MILRRVFVIFILFLLACLSAPQLKAVEAFWIWTPETNQWINPKYSVKDTPQEQLQYALKFLEEKDYVKALPEFKKLIKHYPKAREAAEAQFFIGRSLEEQGQLFKAYKEYQLVIDKYPYSERSAEVVDVQYKIGEKLLEGNDKRSTFVKTVIGAEYDVIEIFRAVIKNAPYGALAAPAQYKIGLYLAEKGLFQEARDEFEKVVNDYPDSEWVKPAKYQIALVDARRSSGVQYEQTVTQTAVAEFKEFVAEYPDAELSKEAKEKIRELNNKEAENNFHVARFYEKQKEYDAARMYYNAVVDDYPESPFAVKALSKLREFDIKKR